MQLRGLSIEHPAAGELMRGIWRAIWSVPRRALTLRASRQLRLCETVSLGNRAYVAVVGYGEQRFLVGGTNHSLALLAQLSIVPAGESVAESRGHEDTHKSGSVE